MNDYTTAIHNNERKERLANALKTNPPLPDYALENDAPEYAPEYEWSYIEDQLRKHNLSIVEIIRSVAKKLHGVDIPPYNPKA